MKRLFLIVLLMGCDAPDTEQSCEDRCKEQVWDYSDAIRGDCPDDPWDVCDVTKFNGTICAELCEDFTACSPVCEAATLDHNMGAMIICMHLYDISDCLWINTPSLWEFCDNEC